MPEMNREEIAKLEALYASNPAGRVFTHLAEAYRKAGEYERARSILEQGLEKHPAYASAHVVLGRVFTDLNDIPQARASFRHVLELDPHNLVALRSLGELARASGNHAEALSYFEELRQHDPGNDDVARLIEEVKQAPAAEPPPAAPAAEAEPEQVRGTFEEPEFGDTSSEGISPEPTTAATLEELPGFESAQPDYGDLVSADIDLGWTAGGEEEGPLPGDLADFANQAPESTETAATPEQQAEAVPEPEAEAVWEPEAVSEPEPEAASEPEPEAEREIAAELASFDVTDLVVSEEEVTYETLASVELSTAEPPSWVPAEEPQAESEPEPQASVEREPEPEPEREAETEPEPLVEAAPEPEPILAAHEPEPEPSVEAPVWAEPVEAAEPAEADEDAPPDDLVTETMAELLVDQGLHEAAADVYRALIRERPWDPDLKKRLGELEALARPAASGAAPDIEAGSPWTSAPPAAASAATPYAWTEEGTPEGEEQGAPIGDYFRSLLSWRPGGPTRQPDREEPVLQLESPAEPEAAESETSELMPWEPPVPPAEVLAPAPPSAPAPEASPARPAARKTDNPVEAAFDEWFNAPEESAESGTPAGESAAEEGEGGDEDDDLEMFRSWLQSLKK